MTKIQKVVEFDGGCDRISVLPRNVIYLIMELLSVRDAARTSILSSQWRYVWANHPSVVLDDKFWADIKGDRLSTNNFWSDMEGDTYCIGIINKILLHHTGNIEKFTVDVSHISSHRNSDCAIDLWLSVLCRGGLKELTLHSYLPNPFPESDLYTIPSCVFSNPELTHLRMFNCIIITPKKETFTGFSRLQSLTLNCVILKSRILITPLLTSLSLMHCLGVGSFSVSAPKLTSLFLGSNDDLNLIPYLVCANITSVNMYLNKISEEHGDVESINLQKLLSSWPKLEQFILDGSSLEYLTTDINDLEDFPLALKLTRFKLVCMDLHQTAWVFRIIGNSPLLQTLELVSSHWITTSDLEALKNLEEARLMNMRMEQLHTVKLMSYKVSTSELQLIKILLHCSPSLKKMLVFENNSMSYPLDHKFNISKDLMRFSRASPKAQIIFE